MFSRLSTKYIKEIINKMKVFARGFNLYGQLIKPTSLVEDFDVIFESEVIKNFGINYSFSYFHTNDSFVVSPKPNKSIKLDRKKIFKIVSNDGRIIILYDDGTLIKLDYNNESFLINKVPRLIDTEEFIEKIDNISSGSKITVFYSKKGKLYTMANLVSFEKNDVVQIECGTEHCLLLDGTGNVYSFGRGSRGQLGHGRLDDEIEPLLVEALAGLKIIKISAGGWHSCALSADGDLYIWGWNSNGQLGLPNLDGEKPVTVQVMPLVVESLNVDFNVTMVAAGNRHTFVLLDNNHLYGCGWNKYKQLTKDTKEQYFSFTYLQDFSKEEVLDLKAGPWNSAVLCK